MYLSVDKSAKEFQRTLLKVWLSVSDKIGHFRNEKGTGAEMCSPITAGIVTSDVPVSYCPIFSPCPGSTPGSLCES